MTKKNHCFNCNNSFLIYYYLRNAMYPNATNKNLTKLVFFLKTKYHSLKVDNFVFNIIHKKKNRLEPQFYITIAVIR